ncbi:GH17557 [Drosophila grimshawi]|uniref:GH17557 n=1 Tax=Drosophila grimshawi TaxID=7222 RepID=B4JXJ8_DROGR|nr:GH17557 [Drosophila grimshawi]
MSSSHSGTIGRKRVGSGSAVGSEFYYGNAASGSAASGAGSAHNGEHQLRRQRSAEWHSHRHGHGHGHGHGLGLGLGMGMGMGMGYGSSSEDEYQNTAQATAFDTQLLAQLLLQSQQLASE